ncbi:MAG: UvrD-helicase domain-containing protein [Bacteriovoracia bacterium]
MSSLERIWTPEQSELIEFVGEHPKLKRVAVLADAGAGKTSVLVERAKRSLELGSPKRVLCISFTVKSSQDLTERLEHYSGAHVFTIHGFCSAILKEFGYYLDLAPNWSLLDASTAESLFNEAFENIYKQFPVDSTKVTARELKQVCFLAKAKKLETYNEEVKSFVKEVLSEFDRKKRRAFQLDYDDLEKKALELLNQDRIANLVSNRYNHVFVDEFQDTNLAQCDLVRRISKDKPLFVVGDSKQSIYRFRGADVSVFETFVSEMPSQRRLSANFRSNSSIIDCVNKVGAISIQGYLPMVAARDDNAKNTVLKVSCNELKEGVVKAIHHSRKMGFDDSQIVVLMPKLRRNQDLLDSLAKEGFFVATSFSGQLDNNSHVISILNAWVAACHPTDRLRNYKLGVDYEIFPRECPDFSLIKKIDKRRKSENFLTELNDTYKLREKHGIIFDQIEAFIVKNGTKSVGEISTIFERFLEEKKGEFFQLLNPPENLDQFGSVLRVMSVHASKGLEFPVVIIADLRANRGPRGTVAELLDRVVFMEKDEDGVINKKPFETLMSLEAQAEISESARLLYVALTRAKERLYVVDEVQEKKGSWLEWIRDSNLTEISAEEALDFVEENEHIRVNESKANKMHNEKPIYFRSRQSITEKKSFDRRNFDLSLSNDGAYVGTRVHECIERKDWAGLDEFCGSFKLDISAFKNWRESFLGRRIYGDDKNSRLYTEFDFDVKLQPDQVFAGRLDALWIDHLAKEIWVLDYKVLTGTRKVAQVVENYLSQMQFYKTAVKKMTVLAFEGYSVRTFLVDVLGSTGQILLELDCRP